MTLWGRRKARRTALQIQLHRRGPRSVLAELEWLQRFYARKPGWIFYSFRDLFGYAPPEDRPAPLPPADDLL